MIDIEHAQTKIKELNDQKAQAIREMDRLMGALDGAIATWEQVIVTLSNPPVVPDAAPTLPDKSEPEVLPMSEIREG